MSEKEKKVSIEEADAIVDHVLELQPDQTLSPELDKKVARIRNFMRLTVGAISWHEYQAQKEK